MTTYETVRDALRRPEGLWTLASNTIPVFGVLFFGWAALPLMVYYWVENVLIGILNLPKILLAGLTKELPQKVLALFLAPFFVLHYGLFCLVHGAFVFGLFAASDAFAGRAQPTTKTFDVFGRVGAILHDDTNFKWSVIGLVAILIFRFVVLWLGRAQWRETDPQRQMTEPYGRIVVLHFALFLAAIPIVALGQPVIGVFFLALFKTALELGLPQFQIGRGVKAQTG
jgi:hypothetical protein